jgi:hypothetical protein
MTVLITLTLAGADTGPFNIYSDSDGYTTPLATGVSKSALLSGYSLAGVPNDATIIRVTSTGTCTNSIDMLIANTTTTTTTSTTSTTTTVPPTTTTTTTPTPGCQQIFLYPSNATACAHLGSLTLFDTDNSLTPTRLWLEGECGVTPVTGGNQWYSQGAGANSYQVDNGGFIIATTACP